MLTLHGLKKPMRKPQISPRHNPDEPDKILTMKDAHKRRKLLKELVEEQKVEQERVLVAPLTTGGVDAWNTWPQIGMREFFHVMRDGAWRGHRAFVIGGGSSLKEFDWSLLNGELTIGVNRAIEKHDVGIMFSMDARVWGFYEKGDFGEEARNIYNSYKGNRVWSLNEFILPEEIYLIKRPGKDISHKVGSVKALETANNSGYGALNLALALGADPVYLLGFDMRGDGKGGQVWWHEGYPAPNRDGYASMRKHFGLLAKNIAKDRVINLNPDSLLKCFPKQKPEEVLKKKNRRPIIVSFYTENTGYKMEAYRMIESCHRFGLEWDVRPVPNMGGWKKNNDYKPHFIRMMLDEHPGRDIVWLDADAVVLQYPELFDNADIDVGLHIVDWHLYPGRERWNKQELLAGTIYVGNNEKSRRLIDAWIRRMAEHKMESDQTALQRVVELDKQQTCEITELPAAYCQIFDTMAAAGEPVIEHTQASRRLKEEVGR